MYNNLFYANLVSSIVFHWGELSASGYKTKRLLRGIFDVKIYADKAMGPIAVEVNRKVAFREARFDNISDNIL